MVSPIHGLLAAIISALVCSAASAQQTDYQRTKEVMAKGRVLSSTSVVAATSGPLGTTKPQGTRIHELFIEYQGGIYLCHLTGSTTSGTPPYASCVGPN